jgi:hypothetical protein
MKNAVIPGWEEGRLTNSPFVGQRKKSNEESFALAFFCPGP